MAIKEGLGGDHDEPSPHNTETPTINPIQPERVIKPPFNTQFADQLRKFLSVQEKR